MRTWPSVPVLALGLIVLAASGSSGSSFGVGNIQGAYGFSFAGAFVDGTRAAAVGSFSADGHGNILNGVRTLSVGYSTGATGIHQTFLRISCCISLTNWTRFSSFSATFCWSNSLSAAGSLKRPQLLGDFEMNFVSSSSGSDTVWLP